MARRFQRSTSSVTKPPTTRFQHENSITLARHAPRHRRPVRTGRRARHTRRHQELAGRALRHVHPLGPGQPDRPRDRLVARQPDARSRNTTTSTRDSIPTKFNADEWVAVAKAAGMKYMVLTTKHHDGFCLWDTKQTDYNIMNTPFKRDVVKELAAACKKAGIAFGTYYSTCDWHHPDFPLHQPRRQEEARDSEPRSLHRIPQGPDQGTAHELRPAVHALVSTCRRNSTPRAAHGVINMAARHPAGHRHQQPHRRQGRLRHAGATHRRVPDRPAVGNLHDHLPPVGLETQRHHEVA